MQATWGSSLGEHLPSVVFVHVSDIHFGQEKGESVHINNDVKEQLLADAREMVGGLLGRTAHGILVTGDVAHSGKKEQYDAAGKWLDRLADAVGCDTFQIQMIPGNHDVDRARLSSGAKHLLDDIRANGSDMYEKILENDLDRASLFARFQDYAQFCEGYDCPLDPHGRYSTNLRVELAPNRAIRFIRMNSSLLCTGDETDKEPELIVGARQFTIPRADGEEAIVLIHHPLHWLKDSEEVSRYFKSRARVVISGHEHDPKAEITPVEIGSDVLMLAAGATVPFKSDEVFTYCYNLIEFSWSSAADALSVTVYARAWNPDQTRFEADKKRLGSGNPTFVLGCPNFRKASLPDRLAEETVPQTVEGALQPTLDTVQALDDEGDGSVPPVVEGYRYLLLCFFRDLTEGERLRLLLSLGAIDPEDDEPLTQAEQRKLFDWLIDQGKIAEVEMMIGQTQSSHDGGNR